MKSPVHCLLSIIINRESLFPRTVHLWNRAEEDRGLVPFFLCGVVHNQRQDGRRWEVPCTVCSASSTEIHLKNGMTDGLIIIFNCKLVVQVLPENLPFFRPISGVARRSVRSNQTLRPFFVGNSSPALPPTTLVATRGGFAGQCRVYSQDHSSSFLEYEVSVYCQECLHFLRRLRLLN